MSKFPDPEKTAKLWEKNLTETSVLPVLETDEWDYNPSLSGIFADAVQRHWEHFWADIEIVADTSDDPVFDKSGVPRVY